MHWIINKAMVPLMQNVTGKMEKADELFYGMEVYIRKECQSGWMYVETFYGYEGYIKKEDVIKVRSRNNLYWIMTSFADVYIRPETKSACPLTLIRGSIVEKVTQESNGYSEIRLYDGRYGYVKTSALSEMVLRDFKEVSGYSEIEMQQLRKSICRTALSYKNVPYRWGGKSPIGIDCSGLCAMTYLLNGLIIYRDAEFQENRGLKKISIQQMEPGDLLYMQGHMGIYMGDQVFLHATNRQGDDRVVLFSLDPDHELFRKDLYHKVLYGATCFAGEVGLEDCC